MSESSYHRTDYDRSIITGVRLLVSSLNTTISNGKKQKAFKLNLPVSVVVERTHRPGVQSDWGSGRIDFSKVKKKSTKAHKMSNCNTITKNSLLICRAVSRGFTCQCPAFYSFVPSVIGCRFLGVKRLSVWGEMKLVKFSFYQQKQKIYKIMLHICALTRKIYIIYI